MIPPEKCFQLYLACKAHFTTANYDAVKYNARVKGADKSHLEQRRDKLLFYSLSKKFDDSKGCASYFVANFAYGNDYPLEDFDRGGELMKRWQKNRQSLTKMFRDDISFLQDMPTSMSFDALVGRNQSHPALFVLMKNGKINVETVSILNDFEQFVDPWMKVNPIWKSDYLRIKKMNSFVKYNPDKFAPLVQELKEEMKD